MADIENWAVATDRKMHENAIRALKEHKKTLRKEKNVQGREKIRISCFRLIWILQR